MPCLAELRQQVLRPDLGLGVDLSGPLGRYARRPFNRPGKIISQLDGPAQTGPHLKIILLIDLELVFVNWASRPADRPGGINPISVGIIRRIDMLLASQLISDVLSNVETPVLVPRTASKSPASRLASGTRAVVKFSQHFNKSAVIRQLICLKSCIVQIKSKKGAGR